jgi:hypothetical protein
MRMISTWKKVIFSRFTRIVTSELAINEVKLNILVVEILLLENVGAVFFFC